MNDGVSFEAKVERWLIRRGARFTERRARQRGKVAARGHECDVHATFVSQLWRLAAFVALVCAFGTAATGSFSDEPALAIFPGTLGVVSVVLLAAFFLAPNHIWVEVKSGEGAVTREVVWKLVQQVADVRLAPVASWRPSAAWLVARSHFDRDTLAFAREHGVRCFVEHGTDIREVI